MKTRPIPLVFPSEKMPFEVGPAIMNLSRVKEGPSGQAVRPFRPVGVANIYFSKERLEINRRGRRGKRAVPLSFPSASSASFRGE